MSGATRIAPGRSYTSVAKLLHWIMALMIFGLIGLGLYMEGLPFSPDKLKYYSWHKWAGVTVFVLVLARLAWRARHRPPALPTTMSPLMRAAAHGGHAALYLLMVAIPLTGWLMSSAKGVPTVWFGVLPIPDLLDKNEDLGDLLQATHKYLNWVFIATLLAHIGAAFKHHLVDKDDILTRMLPNFTRETKT